MTKILWLSLICNKFKNQLSFLFSALNSLSRKIFWNCATGFPLDLQTARELNLQLTLGISWMFLEFDSFLNARISCCFNVCWLVVGWLLVEYLIVVEKSLFVYMLLVVVADCWQSLVTVDWSAAPPERIWLLVGWPVGWPDDCFHYCLSPKCLLTFHL